MAQNLDLQRSASTVASYEDTVRALNTLQCNAAKLKAMAKEVPKANCKLEDTKKYLFRSGITWEQLDSLSVIHVAGTKGKGSTCAFTEAILRAHGFRTGFYSSPHLVRVTERIRINGEPIKEQKFIEHFWKVYDSLQAQKEHEADMPPYFRFLTILMVHVFLDACIDVAILEVGIGGEFDSTNIVRNPICVGVSSLGIDHTSLLGNTLASIALHKSGIFKRNTLAFTAPQPEDALDVLKTRAMEKACSLTVVPDFRSYEWHDDVPTLGIGSDVQETNAALAIQLADAWMAQRESRKRKLDTFNGTESNETHFIPVNDTTRNVPDNEEDGFAKSLNPLNAAIGIDFNEKLQCLLGNVITQDSCADESKHYDEHQQNSITISPSAAYSSGHVEQLNESNSERKYTPNADSLGNCVDAHCRDMHSIKASMANYTGNDSIHSMNSMNSMGGVKSTLSFLSLEKTASALSSCKWPGRFQILRGSTIDFYLDGAHTLESIRICASWYLDETKNTKGKRFLIFNMTGDRNAAKLLEPLSCLNFTRAYFVPNVAGNLSTTDQENLKLTKDLQQIRCQLHCSIWGEGAVQLNTVNEALNHILVEENLSNGNVLESDRPQVLITGSLHLVGAATAVLDPKLTNTTNY